MMDNTGDHVLCCHKLGIYARHNEIRNELADLCGDLNLRADIEKGPDGSLLRPGDVVVHGRFDEPLAVDVGVVHSLQSSTKIAENQPGDMAKKMEQQKVQERRALCQRAGWRFLPFVVETIGVFGGKAQSLMQKLISLWSNTHGCSKREASLLCRTRIELALIRGQARQLERGFPLVESPTVADDFQDPCAF